MRNFAEKHSIVERKKSTTQHHHTTHSEKVYEKVEVAAPEPICVLKIELDDEIIEHIKIFPNEDPEVIVNQFGDKFDLSANAK